MVPASKAMIVSYSIYRSEILYSLVCKFLGLFLTSNTLMGSRWKKDPKLKPKESWISFLYLPTSEAGLFIFFSQYRRKQEDKEILVEKLVSKDLCLFLSLVSLKN